MELGRMGIRGPLLLWSVMSRGLVRLGVLLIAALMRPGQGMGMDGDDAAKFLVRARELRELAQTIKSDHHRKLLIDSAEKFEKLASEAQGAERKTKGT